MVLVAAGSIGQRVGSPTDAVLTLEEVCLVLDGMFLGKVAEDTPLATRGAAAVAENSVYLVLSYELRHARQEFFVCVKLHPRQKLAFERVEYLICVVVVEAQDAAVGSVRRKEIPVLSEQLFTLFAVCKHRRDALGFFRKRRSGDARHAWKEIPSSFVGHVVAKIP